MSAEMNFIEELTEEKKERFHKAVKKLEDMEEKIAPSLDIRYIRSVQRKANGE